MKVRTGEYLWVWFRFASWYASEMARVRMEIHWQNFGATTCLHKTDGDDWSTHQEAKSIFQNSSLPPRVLPCLVFHWLHPIWGCVKRCLQLSLTPSVRRGWIPVCSTQLRPSPVSSPRALQCAISPLENPPGSSFSPLTFSTRVPQMRLAYLDVLLLPGILPSSSAYHICF